VAPADIIEEMAWLRRRIAELEAAAAEPGDGKTTAPAE